MRREIYAAFGIPFPKVPGRVVRFFYEDGSSKVTTEASGDSGDVPEWSTESGRLEEAVIAVCKQYGVSTPAFRNYAAEEN